MFENPLRLALALAVLTLSSACARGGHDNAPYASDVADAADKPIPDSDPCATPNKGCACETNDEVVDCGQVERRSGDYVSCTMGKRTCTSGTWGECIGDRVATISAPSGVKTLALGSSAACPDNPCDPYCQRIADDSTNLAVDAGAFTLDAGLVLKATTPLPSGAGCTGLAVTPASQNITITQANTENVKAEYFNQISTAVSSIPSTWTVTATRNEANIDNNYAGSAPGITGIGATNWSARWTGSVIPTTTEAYTFYTATDDGVRLWINGTLVIDHWQNQVTIEYASAPINLTAGVPALFRFEYYQGNGGSAAFLRWSSATIFKQAIPAANMGTPTGTRPSRLVVSPANPSFSVSLVPSGCYSGTLSAAWTLDRLDIAAVNNGAVNMLGAVPGTLNVTAYAGQFSATGQLNVTVNATDTNFAPAGAVTNLAKAVSGTDPMTFLYPYAATVLPLGLAPPYVQWDNGGTAASAVQVSLRYPATGTPTFSWNEIIPESNPPHATLPQEVWRDLENTAKGQDVGIKIQRVLGTTPAPALSRSVHLSPVPVRGLIYYTQYNRTAWTADVMVADPASSAPAHSSYANPGGCPVCHTVAANGTYLATSDSAWGASNAGLSKITNGVVNPIADFVPSPQRDPYKVNSQDWRGFAWAPLTPDGSLVMAANNVWGNTWDSTVGISTTTARTLNVPSNFESGGTGTGLLAKYYPNTTFTVASPLWKRIDPIVNFDFGTGSPGGLVPVNYSVTRTGLIQAYTSENYTFYVDTVDGVKLTVNGTVLINSLAAQNAAGAAQTSYTGTIAMTAGAKVAIQLDQFDSANESSIKLSWSSPSVPKMIIPETQLYPNDGIHGLDVSYYATANRTGPVVVHRLEPDVFASWGTDSPAAESTLPVDNFSDTWLGQIESPYTGNVTFCVDSDDNTTVTVAGSVVLNVTYGLGQCSGSSLSMTRGTLYSLRIDHADTGGGAFLKLYWKYGTANERVPSANLYPPAGYAAPTTGLTASYYSDQVWNRNLGLNPTTQNSFTRYDSNIYANYGSGRTEYSELTSSDNWSTRWTGLLTAPCSGVYEFNTNGNVDDGGRLWIDQLRVANTWSYAPFYGATYLTAGDHSFKFDWYESANGAGVLLQWKVNCNSAGWTAIPQSAFKPTGDVNKSGMMRDGGDNGNNTSYSIWQTPQTTGSVPVDVSPATAGQWGLGNTAMMVPSFSPDGTKLVFVDGDTAGGAGWRKGLSMFDFNQAGKLFQNRRSLVNTWPLGDVVKWPTFESDSRSVIYQSTVPWDKCCQNNVSVYGYMGPSNYFEDPARLWSLDSQATPPSPVLLTNINSGERPIDANKSYQATVSPQASGGYRWVVFTSTRPYGNTFNLPAVQQDYSNTASYTSMTNTAQIQSQLWVAAVDDTVSAASDRSHPAFWLPGQSFSVSASDYVNERGYWVLQGCKANGSTAASKCDVDQDCCGGLASPKTAICRIDTPTTDPPTRHCSAVAAPGVCVAVGGSCTTTSDCCIGAACVTGTCTTPPPILVPVPGNYERLYQATCGSGTKPVWRFFDWQTVTPSNNSKIEFYAQTSATGTDFATLPNYPTAVSTAGVVTLGVASGAPITSWVGSDVGALLLAAGLKSQQYLKVTMRLVPNDQQSASPTLTQWRQNYSCVPGE